MPQQITGFALLLGHLYNDGWNNAASPTHNSAHCCTHCSYRLTIHSLEKHVFAFGNITTKYCIVHTCPNCKHEVLVSSSKKEKTQKATPRNLAKLFAKLPPELQMQLLASNKGVK